jgi:hypothetical protein
MKTYLKTNKENTFIKLEVKYSKGGTALFTHKIEKRGYYIHISPVFRETDDRGVTFEKYTAFSGYKQNLKEIKRDSEKAYNEAVILANNFQNELINLVLSENNLTLLNN